MTTQVQRVIEEMQAAQLLSIRQSGVIATCAEGRIWVTRDNDTKDTVLGVGESFTTANRDRVIMQALVPSKVFLDCAVPREGSLSCAALLDSIRAAALAVLSRYGLRLRHRGRSDRPSAPA